jgi:hypothetical protein
MIYLCLFKCILFFIESFVVMKETSAFQFTVDNLHICFCKKHQYGVPLKNTKRSANHEWKNLENHINNIN